MKKYFLLLVSMLAITLSGLAITVPKAVSDAFAKKFPGATNIKWEKENATEYEAQFKLNGKPVSANFLTDGSWVETETEISIAELPAAVASVIRAKYPGAVLIKAEKMETAKAGTKYEIGIKTGNKKKELIMNADGTMAK